MSRRSSGSIRSSAAACIGNTITHRQRTRKTTPLYTPGEAPLGQNQVNEGYEPSVILRKDRENRACRVWDVRLRPVHGWFTGSAPLADYRFFPGSLKAHKRRDIVRCGTKGIHYADGWSELADMLEQYGEEHAPTLDLTTTTTTTTNPAENSNTQSAAAASASTTSNQRRRAREDGEEEEGKQETRNKRARVAEASCRPRAFTTAWYIRYKAEAVPSFQEVWPLLRDVGFKIKNSFYCRPSVDPNNDQFTLGMDYFCSSVDLRKHLCAYGIGGRCVDWTSVDRAKLEMWVRYAVVTGLKDNQDKPAFIPGINPVQLLLEIGFGCENDRYYLPGQDPKMATGLLLNQYGPNSLWGYLARFGLPAKENARMKLSHSLYLRLECSIAEVYTGVDIFKRLEYKEGDPPLELSSQPKDTSNEKFSSSRGSDDDDEEEEEPVGDDERTVHFPPSSPLGNVRARVSMSPRKGAIGDGKEETEIVQRDNNGDGEEEQQEDDDVAGKYKSDNNDISGNPCKNDDPDPSDEEATVAAATAGTAAASQEPLEEYLNVLKALEKTRAEIDWLDKCPMYTRMEKAERLAILRPKLEALYKRLEETQI